MNVFDNLGKPVFKKTQQEIFDINGNPKVDVYDVWNKKIKNL